MIEAYSKGVDVAANATVPFNNISLLKGCSSTLQGTGTFQLNKCGIYNVRVSASVEGTAASTGSIQLRKDGVLMPAAFAVETITAVDTIYNLGFDTLVQATGNNNPNCICSAPTNIEVINTGDDVTFDSITITIVRV